MQKQTKEAEAKKYPSWIDTTPVRLSKKLVAWLKPQAQYGESLGDVVERLLKRRMRATKE